MVASGPAAVALVSASSPAFVVVARSAGVAADAGAVLKQLIARFGGRGGGKPDLAQGGGLNGDPMEIALAARAVLRILLRAPRRARSTEPRLAISGRGTCSRIGHPQIEEIQLVLRASVFVR